MLPLFQVQREANVLAIKEVINSITFKKSQNMKKEGFIKFQLGCVQQSCSIDEFGVALGLYKEEDLVRSHNLGILKDQTMVEA